MYEIMKEFTFSASHQLTGLPATHQCARVHGHNYKVVVVLRSETLDSTGFIVDYGELKPIKTFLDEQIDHRFIAATEEQAIEHNIPLEHAFVMGVQSSAENMARYLYERFKPLFSEIYEVRVSETDKTWAIYRNTKHV